MKKMEDAIEKLNNAEALLYEERQKTTETLIEILCNGKNIILENYRISPLSFKYRDEEEGWVNVTRGTVLDYDVISKIFEDVPNILKEIEEDVKEANSQVAALKMIRQLAKIL